VPRRLIRRAALIACVGLFVKRWRRSGDFSKGVDRIWSFRTCCEPDCTFAWCRLAGTQQTEFDFGHSCTHGTYWITFAGHLPDELYCGNAAFLRSGCDALCWYFLADLLPTRTCRASHGIWVSAIFYRPTAAVLACAASVPNCSRPCCAVAAIFSDCVTSALF
jgi:hypothetical protein